MISIEEARRSLADAKGKAEAARINDSIGGFEYSRLIKAQVQAETRLEQAGRDAELLAAEARGAASERLRQQNEEYNIRTSRAAFSYDSKPIAGNQIGYALGYTKAPK